MNENARLSNSALSSSVYMNEHAPYVSMAFLVFIMRLSIFRVAVVAAVGI